MDAVSERTPPFHTRQARTCLFPRDPSLPPPPEHTWLPGGVGVGVVVRMGVARVGSLLTCLSFGFYFLSPPLGACTPGCEIFMEFLMPE